MEIHPIGMRHSITQLKQGTRPSKKITDGKGIKRYLRSCSVSRDGLLVVRREEPFAPIRKCIVVTRNALAGLLTTLHLQLQHLTPYQLKQVQTLFRLGFRQIHWNHVELLSPMCLTQTSNIFASRAINKWPSLKRRYQILTWRTSQVQSIPTFINSVPHHSHQHVLFLMKSVQAYAVVYFYSSYHYIP